MTTGSGAPVPAGEGTAARLGPGGRLSSSLDEESRINLKDGSPMEVFEFRCKAGTALELRSESTEVETHLTIYTPDGELLARSPQTLPGAEPFARVQTLATETGSYMVVVSAGDRNQYGHFELSAETISYEEAGPLPIPSDVTGLLHAGDEALMERNTFVDRHVIKIEEPTTISVEMSSETLDAYLLLTDSRGGIVIGENDDARPGTTDSKLVVELQPGSYQLVATTYTPESQGLYHLSVQSLDLSEGGDLPLPGTKAGRLRG
ncbi:MAG: hypothetical protein ACOC0J_02690, partial [Myxococcota bacterium]